MKIENSFNIACKSIKEFQFLLEKKIKEIGKPSLAIIFVNADLDIAGMNKYMDERQIPHIGASSHGEICDDNFHSGMYTALFMYLPQQHFKIFNSKYCDSILLGEELGMYAKQCFKNPGIYLLIASKNIQTDIYIKEVQRATNNQIPLYGGLAMDNLKFEKYSIFTNGYLSNNGVAAIIFDCDKIDIYGDSYSGWDSIGITHTITKSEDNMLLEIDEKPALDVFTNYFDYFDLEKVAKGEDSSFGIGNHPIKIIEKDGTSSLKSPISIDIEKKSMSFFCSLPKGTKFKFCTNPKIEITYNLIERLKKIETNLKNLDCVIITSCVGRNLTLGPYFKSEVKQIYEISNRPTVGFLSGGEIGNVTESNKSTFHNVTCVFTGFKLK